MSSIKNRRFSCYKLQVQVKNIKTDDESGNKVKHTIQVLSDSRDSGSAIVFAVFADDKPRIA